MSKIKQLCMILAIGLGLLGTNVLPTHAQLTCSEGGTQNPTSIIFINVTNSDVNSFWVSRDCKEINYGTLAPGQSVTQPTYDGHEWVLRDVNGAELARGIAVETQALQLIAAPPLPDKGPVSYEDDFLSFAFEPAVAVGVLATQEEEIIADGPFGNPAYIRYQLVGHALAFDFPHIRLFPTADFDEKFPFLGEQLDKLNAILSGQAISEARQLPLVWNGPPAYFGEPVQIDFANGSGVRYLVYTTFSADPLVEGDIAYTFQGLTDDGSTYVAVHLPIVTGVLPTELPSDFDYVAFQENYESYSTEVFAALDNLDLTTTTPPVPVLDEMVASILVK